MKNKDMRFITLQKGEGYRVVMSEKAEKNHSKPRLHKFFPFNEFTSEKEALAAALNYRDSMLQEHLGQRYGRDDISERLEGLGPSGSALYTSAMNKVVALAEPGVTVRVSKLYREKYDRTDVYFYARASWRELEDSGRKRTKYKDFRIKNIDEIDSKLAEAVKYRKEQAE